MDDAYSRGLLRFMLGFFARKQPEKTAHPASLKSRTREAWLRTDSFLQHDEFDAKDSEGIARTLSALEDYVQDDSGLESDFGLEQYGPYPKLQAVRRMIERSNHDRDANLGTAIRVSKRRRESDDVIQQLSHLDREAKKRRVLPPREEPSSGSNLEDADADFAVLMRRHLMSLDNALRQHWVCVCQKCSGLSVRLSLPQRKRDSGTEMSFEVFFGVRSVPATALQEAKITVKDIHDRRLRSLSEPTLSNPTDFVHICQDIAESLDQRNCLHFALEGGIFQRLRPQPKTFGSDRVSRTVSLSALFNRQQELPGGRSALPLKGKRVLALTLATALLPFLETPWLQPSFNHSNIQFFEPLQDRELPNITKPFLALEHIPIISARDTNNDDSSRASKHMVHPNASVLALGILLCELHYCTPVKLMAKDATAARNVNTDYYTSLDMLKTLEVDAGLDYYLATKACLQWEYLPPGQHADFESVSVQRLFYQNVVKRLEAEMFKSWSIQLENLGSFDSRQNELCWGDFGREFVRSQTGNADTSDTNNGARTNPHRSMSDSVPVNRTSLDSNVLLRMSAQPSSGLHVHADVAKPSEHSLYFFDASHQTGPTQE
ncbi:putative Peptidase S8/S53 domain-containing protein [Seiridium unicorne]|uniref:Peptidase S8/S53 domain-containing protein n=1 Tax=Seiridium unicorne TaxID=138068 RepID=A0ABR2V9W5_9PEZI